MIDSYTSSNHHDFNARYAGTYGWLLSDKVSGERSFVHLIEADGERLTFDMGGSLVYNTNINSGVRFQFIPVSRGWFASKDGRVLFLERIPARQWKRGISSQNTTVRDSNGLMGVKLTYAVLSDIFTKDDHRSPYKPSEPYCISQHFAINPYNQVYCFNIHVGDLKGNTITLNDTLSVAQELRDAIRRANLAFLVE